jgi:alkanesulfonate monooxygenase SsuD/methylene tetrahydromethanopterin reductase-like flavin-dependent oxidoreductase (luciferase family)
MLHPVRFGLKVPTQNCSVDEMRTCWKIAEDAGFDHLWNFDHLAGVKASGLASPIFEGWTALAAMAEATERIRIGCMVTGNAYRHPAMLAKMAVTVDHLSGGRLEFGIGAGGWPDRESSMFQMAGLDHLVGRLDESLRIFRLLWTQERSTFAGRYYQLNDAVANPKPLQKPYPPIWIGTVGELTLKVVARHADVWNVTASFVKSPLEAAELGRRFRDECAAQGRHAGDLRWSAQIFWDAKYAGVLRENVATYLELGFTEIVIFPDVRATGESPITASERAATELAGLRKLKPSAAAAR